MKIVFKEPEDGANPKISRLVKHVELHFDDSSIMRGLRLVGFTLRARPDGTMYVLGPAKVFGAPGARRYIEYVRPADPSVEWSDAIAHLQSEIIKAYREIQ